MSHAEYLNSVANECVEYLTRLNVPIGYVVDFTVNTRAHTRWGQCKYRPDGYHININKALCDGKHEEGLKATIMHELLHTCSGCMNHGRIWKGWANKVTRETGLIIQTRDSAEDKGFCKGEIPLGKRPIKYRLICKSCGHVNSYRTKSRAVKYYDSYCCGLCSGKLELVVISQQEGR